jgi:hypothetical protein
MEEEKQGMEEELVKWKEEFIQQNQREPEEADKYFLSELLSGTHLKYFIDLIQ